MQYQEGKSQAERRRSWSAFDQWGREWGVNIELLSGDPTGPINPCFNDGPPVLYTPQKYIRCPRENPRSVSIDYPRWIEDQERAVQEHEVRASEIMNSMYPGIPWAGADMPVLERLEKLPFDVRRLLGKAPLNPAVIRQASEGDAVLLGLKQSARPEPVTVTPATYAVQTPRKPGRPKKVVEV